MNIIKKLFFLCLVFGYSEIRAEINIEQPKCFTAHSGLHTCVFERKDSGSVSLALAYKVGSADEPAGLSGMAHLLEHMLFKSAKNRFYGTFTDRMTKIGASYNATTSKEATIYYVSALPEYIPELLKIESDRMRNLSFMANDVDVEKQVVLEERSQRIENNDFILLLEEMDSTIFTTWDYSHPVSGYHSEINRISKHDLESFYKKYYKPSNAFLVIVGDITEQEARISVNRAFGRKKDKLPGNKRFPTRLSSRDTKISFKREGLNVQQEKIITYSPLDIKSLSDESLAAQIAHYSLFSAKNSRLRNNLVNDHNAPLTDFYCDYNPFTSKWMISCFILPLEKVSVDDAINAFNSEMVKLADIGITEEEKELAVNTIITNLIYLEESPELLAYYYARLLAVSDDIEDVHSMRANYIDKIRNISINKINEVALSTFLKPESHNAVGFLFKKKNTFEK